MTPLSALLRLSQRRGHGISCDETGLHVGDTQLLEQVGIGDVVWRPRRLENLNDELSRSYGFPVDLDSKKGQLASVAKALTAGDLVLAQIGALHLRLPDPPGTDADRTDLVFRLAAAGLLNKILWDESQHPRQPAGSPDSVGGQFAPAGEVGAVSSSEDDSPTSPSASAASADQQRTLHFQTNIVGDNGAVSGTFFITPASKRGGVIVQKIVSTDTVQGKVERQLVLWEAWEIAPGAIATNEGQPDDEWTAPAPSPLPSLAALRTTTAEARFYEGISKTDLEETYGFTVGGSGNSGDLLSTKRDPHLPTEDATAPLTRSNTSIAW